MEVAVVYSKEVKVVVVVVVVTGERDLQSVTRTTKYGIRWRRARSGTITLVVELWGGTANHPVV